MVPVTNSAVSEVEDRVGDLLGRAEAADRLPRAQRVERLADVLDEAAHPRRVDRAGADGVDADAVADVVDRERARERDDGALRGASRRRGCAVPTSAATDATLTIEPPPRAAIPGIACLQQRNVPRALTAKTFSQTSSGVSGAFVVEPMPATLTSRSRSSIAAAT